ncbi:hypothetical protein D9M72_520320 [compost metagenome]
MPTMSSLPSAIAWRAVATSAMRAAWKTGNFVAALTSPAKSRCGEAAMPWIGMTLVKGASWSICPRMMLRKSTLPEFARRRAISMPSSFDNPFSQSSSATIRMPTMKSGPTDLRMASSTMWVKRRRLSSEPPKSSSRWLVAGDQKPSIRWP